MHSGLPYKMWLKACSPQWSSSHTSPSLWHCRYCIVDLLLDSSRPPSRRLQCGSWSPCTDPQAGPAAWNLPSRSLAGCWYQASPLSPPAIIKLLIFDSITLPCWRLLWGRVQGVGWWHQTFLIKKFGKFSGQLAVVILSSFSSDISVTTKSSNKLCAFFEGWDTYFKNPRECAELLIQLIHYCV